ncbi:MAG: hypothetical protein LAQ30_03490 [Acidobacteriia bacterium]|nr:hypothetical protein [Terriglobia bacterium]
MFTSVLIIVLSFALLVYWFRYSCLLLLRSRSAAPVCPADLRFSIEKVQQQLKAGDDLDPLHRSLQRDYALFIFLVEHASGLSLQSFDDRLLVWDYKVLQLWYGLTKAVFPSQARQALTEMADIMAVLLKRIAEQAGTYVEA